MPLHSVREKDRPKEMGWQMARDAKVAGASVAVAA